MGSNGNFTTIILYFCGLAVFGFFYWLMNGILTIIRDVHTEGSTFTSTYDFLFYVWAGLVIIYLVFGGIWLIRQFEQNTQGAN